MTTLAREQPAALWTTDVLQSVWERSRPARVAAHRAAGRSSCTLRTPPRSMLDLDKTLAECTSVGCADVVQELLARVVSRLASRAPATDVALPGAWLARVVDNELSELGRARRRLQGGPVRPGRVDGVPGRVNAAIEQATPEQEEREWRLTLFRLIRCYPYRGPLAPTTWPVEQWALEKAGYLSSHIPDAQDVTADIHTVLMIATEVAGASWVFRTILEPMSRRVDPPTPDQPTPGPDVLDRALLLLAADTFSQARARGLDPAQSWAVAMDAIGGAVARPPAWAVELLETYAVTS